MKKLFTIFALTAVLALSLAPVVLAGQTTPQAGGAISPLPNSCAMKHLVGAGCPVVGQPCTVGETDADGTFNCGLCCLLNTVYTVTSWIFFIMLTLAVVLIIIGGIMYMISGGDPAKTKKGKDFITYAIVGLVIALLARFLPPIVKFILGVQAV